MFSIFKSLFQRRTAGSERSARPVPSRNKRRRAFLSVEALEDRCVPATLAVTSTLHDLPAGTPSEVTGGPVELANVTTLVPDIQGAVVSLPGGTLHVSSENVSTGAFDGTFADAKSGISVPIHGELGLQVGPMVFNGVARKGLETEHVTFSGNLVNRNPVPGPGGVVAEYGFVGPYKMVGSLTETCAFPTHVLLTSTPVDAVVQEQVVIAQSGIPAHLDLTRFTFAKPNGTLQVTSENVARGDFQGTFFDSGSGIDVTVHGKLTSLGGNMDAVVFHGVNQHGAETEQVAFTGKIPEAPEASFADAMTPEMTGAYQHFHGQGKLTLTLHESPTPGHHTGTFSLHF